VDVGICRVDVNHSDGVKSSGRKRMVPFQIPAKILNKQ
jgi:hypothetical protein